MQATRSRNCLTELLRGADLGQWQRRCPHQLAPSRGMTRGRSVKERSKKKRVHALEVATERWKVLSKVLTVVDALKKEEEHVTPLKRLEILRPQLGLTKPHKVAHFIRHSPRLFEVCRDSRGVMWAGLSPQAEELVEEEARLLEEHAHTAVQYVTRMLMMSVDRRLPVDKIAHFRRDMGLPHDFRTLTELEKKASALAGNADVKTNPGTPGVLSLPFPMKFPPDFTSYYKFRGKVHHYVKTGNTEQFQKVTYLSPYAEAKGLTPGSPEFDKRAVAVMHEILSFMLERRLVTDHLTHFRREFVMPQKLMRLLLKHYGIFYVSERGKRLSVFLTEAYDGTELIEKCPLVRWREKVLQLTGYRGRIKNLGKLGKSSNSDDYFLGVDGASSDDDAILDVESEHSDDVLDDPSISDGSEMDVGDMSEFAETE
ncbi:hypothetical protein PR202_ga26846 [Eleusine coracana subsp. coracana]|uniref:PORR domain-containing protein n=1 Tax=Eleusine coracana subsp. coracana TaxID=191504 RepID=A0AAV5DFC2_ELECO|nr:hypothetical protein PR202_ga26846 [Eleusine coracana subsp. coracana]